MMYPLCKKNSSVPLKKAAGFSAIMHSKCAITCSNVLIHGSSALRGVIKDKLISGELIYSSTVLKYFFYYSNTMNRIQMHTHA